MSIKFALFALSLSLAASNVSAQSQMDHSQMKGMDMSKPDSMKMNQKSDSTKMDQKSDGSVMTEGEVRKIDKEQGKITLKHEEIKNLGMPGMTMTFRTQDKTMLDQVKEGDKVKFTADNVNNQLTVTKMERAK